MRPLARLFFGCVVLLCAGSAPATQKPCRDAHGRIIVCPPPRPKPAPTRCKDEKGRFVACKPPVSTVDRG